MGTAPPLANPAVNPFKFTPSTGGATNSQALYIGSIAGRPASARQSGAGQPTGGQNGGASQPVYTVPRTSQVAVPTGQGVIFE